jgi:hypothetical protein
MVDEREDELRRPPPKTVYQAVALQLQVPRDALSATLTLLLRADGRECGVFWYGKRDVDGNGLVTYVVAPRQRMSRGNYHVPPDALAEVVHRLPPDCKPLAQLHSHPGLDVEHSIYDDRMASSRRVLSLVFPLYGRLPSTFPVGVGVHEWQVDYWHLLSLEQALRRVVLCDGAITMDDLR